MATVSDAQAKKMFGTFKYTSKKDGSAIIDPAWVKDNIATLHTVLVPNIRCHIKAARQIASALHKVYLEGLSGVIQTYDGCWVPRHKGWDPKRGLSIHAYGAALDFNAATNPMGKYNDELFAVAQIFKEFGFLWGGDWKGKYCDPMHFELYSLWD